MPTLSWPHPNRTPLQFQLLSPEPQPARHTSRRNIPLPPKGIVTLPHVQETDKEMIAALPSLAKISYDLFENTSNGFRITEEFGTDESTRPHSLSMADFTDKNHETWMGQSSTTWNKWKISLVTSYVEKQYKDTIATSNRLKMQYLRIRCWEVVLAVILQKYDPCMPLANVDCCDWIRNQ